MRPGTGQSRRGSSRRRGLRAADRREHRPEDQCRDLFTHRVDTQDLLGHPVDHGRCRMDYSDPSSSCRFVTAAAGPGRFRCEPLGDSDQLCDHPPERAQAGGMGNRLGLSCRGYRRGSRDALVLDSASRCRMDGSICAADRLIDSGSSCQSSPGRYCQIPGAAVAFIYSQCRRRGGRVHVHEERARHHRRSSARYYGDRDSTSSDGVIPLQEHGSDPGEPAGHPDRAHGSQYRYGIHRA